ncbi:MAG: hypothetical protein HYV26_08940 [Candidatus Hydrogenedentes bacterium]|nr:hypothetical protein [Candidatus Hydrogenedentota bacterium]
MEPARVLAIVPFLIMTLWGKAGSVALVIWADALWPSRAERVHSLYARHPRRCVLTGLVNATLMVFIGIALISTKVLGLLGLLVLGLLIVLIVLGYGCAYESFGRHIAAATPMPRWKMLLCGGLLAELAFLAPVIGQLFSLGVLFRGLGAVILALLGRTASLPHHHATPASPLTLDDDQA